MNFVLTHIGNNIPEHVKYCIKQIQSTNPESDIYFITNLNVKQEGINIINTADIIVPDIKSYYLHDPMGPLFRNAMLRIFYIKSFMDKTNMQNVIHFDNDVLIYKNVESIKERLINYKFLMTAHNEKDYVFGFSYIKNKDSLDFVNKELYELVIKGENQLQSMIGSMPHEMRLLNYVNNINNGNFIDMLPVVPTGTGSDNFNVFNECFDPSSYGQYLGGLAPERDKYIGSKIIENKIRVVLDNRKPYVIIDNMRHSIFNLHVHNKQLHNFL